VKKALLILTLTIWLSFGQQADACLMHDLSMDPQYQANSNLTVGWLTLESSSGTIGHGSVVNINSEWGITAAHNIDNYYGFYNPLEVGFGPNLYDIPGQTRMIDSFLIYPDWNQINSHDLALVHYASPLSGLLGNTIPDAALSVGDTIQFSGYGRPGTNSNLMEYDGIRRGFDGEVTQFGDPGKVPAYYLTSEWTYANLSGGFPLGGLGTPGDSGGGVFDESGILVAIMTGVSCTDCNIYGIDTYAIGLWEESVQTWITETTGVTAVPIPGAIWLFGTGVVGLAGLKVRRTIR
jgi:hypothetical protein